MSDQVHTPPLEQIRHELGIEGVDLELPPGVEALILPAELAMQVEHSGFISDTCRTLEAFDPSAVYPLDADEGAPEPGSVGACIDPDATRIATIAPRPDEWNRLHYIAELERIESNLRVWYDPNVTTGRGLVVDQMAEDQATLLAVLRRADAVIRAQAADLAELRQRTQVQTVKFLGVIAEAQEALSAAERALREVA